MAELTDNFNYLQPTSFKLTVDRRNYPNLEFFLQSFVHPGMIMNSVEVPYKKLTGIPFIGDKLTFNELQANILLDEDMKSYDEMYSWMRRILDLGNVTAYEATANTPPSVSDMTLTILSSHNNITRQIKFIDCIPTALTDIQFESTAAGDSFISFGASFRFSYFELSGAAYTTNINGLPNITVNRSIAGSTITES